MIILAMYEYITTEISFQKIGIGGYWGSNSDVPKLDSSYIQDIRAI